MKKILPLLFFLAAFTIAFPIRSFAQMIWKVSAIPPRLEISADPGEVIAEQIKVRNEGDTQLGLQVKIQDFVVTDKEGTPITVEGDETNRWAASQWISVSPNKFLINPGELKNLDLVVVIPEDAAAGGHYAVVFYTNVEEGTIGAEGTGAAGAAQISPNVGTLVYITVSGEIEENARVTKMEIPRFQEYGPVKIQSEILNLSDVHIKPVGTIRIYDTLGKLKTTLKLEEQNIFPGASRTYKNTWQQKWGLGKYKAQLSAGYGESGKSLIATTFFWIIPWRVLTIALLAIVLVILLVAYLKKPKEIKK